MAKKSFASLILMMLCVFALCGCASVEYQQIQYSDGSIEDNIVCEIDSTADNPTITQTVSDTILNKLQKDLQNNYVTPVNTALDELVTKYPFIADNVEVSVIKNLQLRTIKLSTYCASVDYYSVLVNEVYPLVYKEITASESTESVDVSSTAFIKKYIQTQSNAFGDVTQFSLTLQSSPDKIKNFFNDYKTITIGDSTTINFTLDDLKLYQLYATSDSRLKTNASVTGKDSRGLYLHLWSIDPNASASTMLEFYYETANPIGWYYLALGITAFALIMIVTIYFIKKRPTSKVYKTPVTNEDDDDTDYDL